METFKILRIKIMLASISLTDREDLYYTLSILSLI